MYLSIANIYKIGDEGKMKIGASICGLVPRTYLLKTPLIIKEDFLYSESIQDISHIFALVHCIF